MLLAIAVEQVVQQFVEGRLGVFEFLQRGVERRQRELRRTAFALGRKLRLQGVEGRFHALGGGQHAVHRGGFFGSRLFWGHR
ncbi:hypothetical protein PT2222_430021 [Paraburkholderia tropica]